MNRFELTPNQRNVIIALGVCSFIYLFLARSVLFYIPLFGAILYFLWKKSNLNISKFSGEEDPADWWKKETPSDLDEL